MSTPVDWRAWSIPPVALQALGVVCLTVGVWMVYSGRHVLAVFGFAVLLATTELRLRRPPRPE